MDAVDDGYKAHPGLPYDKQERFEHPGLDKFAEGSNI